MFDPLVGSDPGHVMIATVLVAVVSLAVVLVGNAVQRSHARVKLAELEAERQELERL